MVYCRATAEKYEVIKVILKSDAGWYGNSINEGMFPVCLPAPAAAGGRI